MEAERQHKEANSRVIQSSKGGGGYIVDNRPQSTTQRKLLKLVYNSGNPIQRVRMLGVPAAPVAPAFLNGHALASHHIIPNTVFQHAIEDALGAFHGQIDNLIAVFDGQWNGIRLPNGVNRVDSPNGLFGRPGHNGNHPAYSTAVETYSAANNTVGNLSGLLAGANAAQDRANIANHIRGLITNTAQQNLDAMATAGEI